MKYLDLDLKRPVPSDIEIARAQTPKDIGIIASEAGILDSELCRYGNTKAKVSLKGTLIQAKFDPFWAKYLHLTHPIFSVEQIEKLNQW